MRSPERRSDSARQQKAGLSSDVAMAWASWLYSCHAASASDPEAAIQFGPISIACEDSSLRRRVSTLRMEARPLLAEGRPPRLKPADGHDDRPGFHSLVKCFTPRIRPLMSLCIVGSMLAVMSLPCGSLQRIPYAGSPRFSRAKKDAGMPLPGLHRGARETARYRLAPPRRRLCPTTVKETA